MTTALDLISSSLRSIVSLTCFVAGLTAVALSRWVCEKLKPPV